MLMGQVVVTVIVIEIVVPLVEMAVVVDGSVSDPGHVSRDAGLVLAVAARVRRRYVEEAGPQSFAMVHLCARATSMASAPKVPVALMLTCVPSSLARMVGCAGSAIQLLSTRSIILSDGAPLSACPTHQGKL